MLGDIEGILPCCLQTAAAKHVKFPIVTEYKQVVYERY
jgi:hypothetical protein